MPPPWERVYLPAFLLLETGSNFWGQDVLIYRRCKNNKKTPVARNLLAFLRHPNFLLYWRAKQGTFTWPLHRLGSISEIFWWRCERHSSGGDKGLRASLLTSIRVWNILCLKVVNKRKMFRFLQLFVGLRRSQRGRRAKRQNLLLYRNTLNLTWIVLDLPVVPYLASPFWKVPLSPGTTTKVL